MAVKTISQLKALWVANYKPTEADFKDLFDTIFSDTAGMGNVIANAITALIDGAPANLNTLDKLAAAINDDPAFSSTVASAIGSAANSAQDGAIAAIRDGVAESLNTLAKVATALSGKAADGDVVKLTGNQNVSGIKTFETVVRSDDDPAADNDLTRRVWTEGRYKRITDQWGEVIFSTPSEFDVADRNFNKILEVINDADVEVVGSVDGDSGQLLIVQDGGGGHTITLVGVVLPSAVSQNTGAGESTLLVWDNIGGTIHWSGKSEDESGGAGVPPGGAANHVFRKNSATDYDTSWANIYTLLAQTASTGTAIVYDMPRYYGKTTAETGNITHSLTAAIDGMVGVVRHNNSAEPTYPASWVKTSDSGNYVNGVDNYIWYWLANAATGVVHYKIYQL